MREAKKMTDAEPTAAVREIEGIANRLYNGRMERGFLHWALGCILADIEPAEEELVAHTAVDGPGDLGIDGYWLDEANNRLVLVQAKFQGRVGRAPAQEFRQAIHALKDEHYVRHHGNAALKEIYPEILDSLLDEDFPIYAVLACRGRVASAALSYASGEGSAPWLFDFSGTTRRKELQLQVLDTPNLASLRETLIAGAVESPEVHLPVARFNHGVSCHEMGGRFRAMQATVPARSIAEAYGRYRSAIFRYNPRGPLGSNRVNREIEATLKDDTLKGNFHLLNNGLTIVCDSVRYSEASQSLDVRDFQIVNGCQTAFTLHTLQEDLTDDVLVSVRVIEGLQNWVSDIAKATNFQTAVRPEQLASLGAEHDRLRQAFDALSPPWYYERQQGSTRFQTPIQRALHRTRYQDRALTVKEVGQFGAAFVGQPILAKYNLKVVFERSEQTGRSLYDGMFRSENEPEQLLLPVLVGRKVWERVKQRMDALGSQQTEEAESLGFSELDWVPYARVHLVGLIGEVLRSQTPSEVRGPGLLSGVESRRRLATLNDWFQAAFERAFGAVEFYVEVERAADRLANLREFFRNDEIYRNMAGRARRR
jgi:hypothetical protein